MEINMPPFLQKSLLFIGSIMEIYGISMPYNPIKTTEQFHKKILKTALTCATYFLVIGVALQMIINFVIVVTQISDPLEIMEEAVCTGCMLESYFCWNISMISLFNLFPLIKMAINRYNRTEVHRLLPYPIWYPFEVESSLGYLTLYIFYSCVGFVTLIGLLVPDCLLIILTSHIVWCYDDLKDQLQQVLSCKRNAFAEFDHDELNISSKVTKKNVYENLSPLVSIHQQLIRLSVTLERMFGEVILISFIVESLMLCMVAFEVTAGDAEEISKYAMLLVSSVSRVYIICWYGERLAQKSEGVVQAIESSDWYTHDTRTKKVLLIMIIRSQKPCCLSVSKFSIVTMGCFMSILKTSWSYFTLLRTMHESPSLHSNMHESPSP